MRKAFVVLCAFDLFAFGDASSIQNLSIGHSINSIETI